MKKPKGVMVREKPLEELSDEDKKLVESGWWLLTPEEWKEAKWSLA